MLATSAPEITACKQAVAPRGAGHSDRLLESVTIETVGKVSAAAAGGKRGPRGT